MFTLTEQLNALKIKVKDVSDILGITESNKDFDVLLDTFEGQTLANRYRIDDFLDAGCVG